jgi:hypothetical protein
MDLTTRWVGKEPKGAKTDGTNGTHETNAISLCVDIERAGGTFMVLLAPELITALPVTDYFFLLPPSSYFTGVAFCG